MLLRDGKTTDSNGGLVLQGGWPSYEALRLTTGLLTSKGLDGLKTIATSTVTTEI